MVRLSAGVFVLALMVIAHPGRSALHSDEQVILYPALARPVNGGFEVSVRGVVFEPERRPVMTWLVRQLTGLEEKDLTPAEWGIFKDRCRYFLVDHERGKQMPIQLGEETLARVKSVANGHFSADLRWQTNRVAMPTERTNKVITLVVSLDGGVARKVPLDVHVWAEKGVSVISDIDDTIKISEVLDRAALLRNSFCQAFKPVPGMAEVYQHWAAANDAQFHYVTASPWQLYQPLSEFIQAHHFPAGTFHMKDFRLKDRTAVDILTSPERYKPGAIEPLLRKFPKRHFVLVGDSGEKDPEIYGALAREYPKQIRAILIREVLATPQVQRYAKAFAGLPAEKWRLFKEPAEIQDILQ